MNTATRVIAAQGVIRITVRGISITLLICGLLLSAFGVVYIKDLNRRLFMHYQTLQAQKAQSLVQWGKLLLEQSTWSTQSRIQQIAQKQLGMIVPRANDVVLVESNDATKTR